MDRLQIQDLARQAGIDLPDGEEEPLREDLARILEHFDNLSGVDTSAIPATSRVFEGAAELQDDEVRPGLTHQDVETMAEDVFDVNAGVFRLQGVLPTSGR